MADAMEKSHPQERHFYLCFAAVAPRVQGLALGDAFLDAAVRRADALAVRAGFVVRNNIAPAPPLLAMWRDRR